MGKFRNLFRGRPEGKDAVDQASQAVANNKEREKYGLFPLNPTPASTTFDFDVVAVHGLGGDWESTWTDDTTGKLWLRDFLPTQFPRARVWSFGYNSEVLSQSVEDIDDAANSLVDSLVGVRRSTKKPIVFVAHSLGGIIVKRALILSNERSDHWEDIKEKTIAAVFFSVPHRGADLAYWANFATALVNFTSLGSFGNRNFVEALKRNSAEFSKISYAFVQPASKLNIIRTFYETDKIGNSIIVDKDSASLRVNNELPVPIPGADHRNICKFASAESQRYMPVRNALEGILSRDVETSVDNAIVRKRIDEHTQQARSGWQKKIVEEAGCTQDFEWAINMPQARSWKAARNYSLLYVEYDDSGRWQATISMHFYQHLQSEGIVLIPALVSNDTPNVESEMWRASLPRMLLAQLLSLYPRVIAQMRDTVNLLQADSVFPVSNNRKKLSASWESSFCSVDSPWQQQWILLACALHCIEEEIVLLLVGFTDELYPALDEGLRLLDPRYYPDSLASAPGVPHFTRYKALIVGRARSKTKHREEQFDSLASLSNRINEGAEREECLSSLYFPEMHARRNRVDKAEEGTTNWIWEHPAYMSWCGNTSSLLWVYGKPGSGKSTLAAALQLSITKYIPGLILADFFYSSRGGPTETGHCWMLRSILHQLLWHHPTLFPLCRLAFRKFKSSQSDPWQYELLAETLAGLQKSAVDERECRTFLFIIDGLDESEDGHGKDSSRAQTLQLFSQLCCAKGKNVFKVIALSRPEPTIKSALRATFSIDMKEENEADIQRIVTYGIFKLWKDLSAVSEDGETDEASSALSPRGSSAYRVTSTEMDNVEGIPELEFVRQHLVKYADGVILWVVMVLRELSSTVKSGVCRIADLEQRLLKVPTSLKDLYRDIFVRLDLTGSNSPDSDSRESQASYIFAWLLFSETTLTVREIRDAMAMFFCDNSSQQPQEEFLKKNRVIQPNGRWEPVWTLLAKLCGGFVEILVETRPTAHGSRVEHHIGPDDNVQLVHRTARDFLLEDSSSAFLHLDNSRSLHTVCTACVNYLELPLNMAPDVGLETAWESLVRCMDDRPLLRYILYYLSRNLSKQRYSGESVAESLWIRITRYMRNAYYGRWLSVTWWLFKQWFFNLVPEYNNDSFKTGEDFFDELLETEDRSIDSIIVTAPPTFLQDLKQRAKQLEEETELNERGHHPITEDFIPNALLGYGLYYATKLGCSTALRVFIAAGAHTNILGTSALCEAAALGSLTMVRILLKSNARVDKRSLSSAISGGNDLVVRELLSHWDQPEVTGIRLETSLMKDLEELENLAESSARNSAQIKIALKEYRTALPETRSPSSSVPSSISLDSGPNDPTYTEEFRGINRIFEEGHRRASV